MDLIQQLSQEDIAHFEYLSKRYPEVATIFRRHVGSSLGSHLDNDSWKRYTLADAFKVRPPIPYIVDGIFYRPSLSIVYGPPGSLKTMLMLDNLATVATGGSWLPAGNGNDLVKGIKTVQASGMYIDFDNGVRITHERIEAVARSRNISPKDTNLVYYCMPEPRLDGQVEESIKDLKERIKLNNTNFVVIDNLTSVSGGADENSVEIGRVMTNFRSLAEETETAIVFIHHSRKRSQVSARAGDSLRGHSSIEAALDLALSVEREPNSDTIHIYPTKVRGIKIDPFHALFTYQNKTDGSLAEVRFLCVEGDRIASLHQSKKASDNQIEEAIIQVVTTGTVNQKDLLEAVKKVVAEASEHRILGAIHRLVFQEKIIEEKGKVGREKLYKNIKS